MKSNQITTGARVRFTARGREITGTVTGYKYTTPGARMDIVKLGLVPIIRHRKLEVLPDEGGGIWTVSEHSCKCVGRAKDSTEALLKATELKSFVKQQRQKRYSENTEICNERGLFELKKGDKILVEFRGGRKLECRFDKLTGAGMVGFYRDGDNVFDSLGLTKTPRVRFTAPEYVTKI